MIESQIRLFDIYIFSFSTDNHKYTGIKMSEDSNINNHTQQQQTTTLGSAPQPTLNNDPVLTRLKELEDSNNSNAKIVEQMQRELREKDERIKTLSADKRKEMETILATAIDNWLNSLAGVSEENKANFRQGICKLAERADMNNAAWEIVCHASKNHKSNVERIEELLQKTQQQEQEIGDLKGFRNEASRISGHKRGRAENGTTITGDSLLSTKHTVPEASLHDDNNHHTSNTSTSNNTWDLFQSMISRDFKSQYF